MLAWEQIRADRLVAILLLLDEVREDIVNASTHQSPKVALNALELHEGRLRQVRISGKADLAGIEPIWVDLVAPSAEMRPFRSTRRSRQPAGTC